MLKYVLKRLLYMVFVFVFMSVVLFALYSLIPGDPARAEVEPMRDQLSPDEYQVRYEMARERLGLDQPTHIRYYRWASNFMRGDFGMSQQYKKPVVEVVVSPFRVTIFYNLFVIFLILLITIPLGIVCALKKNSTFDKIVQVVTIIGFSIPPFIFALLFIYVFSVTLEWFPVSGLRTANFQGTWWEAQKDMIWHLTLPVMALTFASLGGMTRYVRAAMTEALHMECIRTARAKGLRERVVIMSHAWRNALLPIITLLIATFMSLFSGSLILEQMFLINGMGQFLYQSLVNQDYNVTIALQLFYVILALVTNLIVDLSYGIVDPRVRVNK